MNGEGPMAQLPEQTALAGKRKASGDAAQAHKKAAHSEPVVAPAPAKKAADALDDIFGAASIKGRSGAAKQNGHAGPDAKAGNAAAPNPSCRSSGPDMEQVKKEAKAFLSRGGSQRAVVDGVKIYSEKELEEEMGEEAWRAFQDAADESEAKGLTAKDYW